MSTGKLKQDRPDGWTPDDSDSDEDSLVPDASEPQRRQEGDASSSASLPDYDGQSTTASKEEGIICPCKQPGCRWPCDHHRHDGHVTVDFRVAYEEIERSALEGCVYCAIICHIADGTCGCKVVLPGVPQHKHFCTQIHYSSDRLCLIFYWDCGFRYIDIRPKQESIAVTSTLCVPTISPLPLPTKEAMRTTLAKYPLQTERRFKAFRNRLSDPAIELYSSWLTECENTHQDCLVKDSTFCPTRLLDLSGDTMTSSVRLVLPGNVNRSYAALSYCWGGRDPSLTTHQNIKKRLDCIPFKELPKCYQDAVCLLRRLHIRYLWIDALCILQDDIKDWYREASQMGKVYTSARFVVIAAMAASVDSGFLRRKVRRWHTVPFRALSDPKTRIQVSAKRHAESYGSRPSASMPVGYRGWCYQEHAMARRCIIFNDDEVVWECREGFKCECKRTGSEDLYKPSVMKSKVPEDRDNIWLAMVEDFSWTKFTFLKDRLPALAALASHLKTSTDAEYLAGLWRMDLLPQLLWERGADDCIARPEIFVAPSWSWASFPSGISAWLVRQLRDEKSSQTKRSAQREALVVGTWCSPSGTDPFGAVNGGAIQLQAYHCLATVEFEDDSCVASLESGCEIELSQSNFDWLVTSVPLMTVSAQGRQTLQAQGDTDGELLPPPRRKLSGDVRFLEVVEGYYLILAYSQREDGAFERLGLLTPLSRPSLTLEKRRQIQAACARSVLKII